MYSWRLDLSSAALARTPLDLVRSTTLLLAVKHDGHDIKRELRHLNTQLLEGVPNLVTQDVALIGPKRGHGSPNRHILRGCVRVDVSSIRQFSSG